MWYDYHPRFSEREEQGKMQPQSNYPKASDIVCVLDQGVEPVVCVLPRVVLLK